MPLQTIQSEPDHMTLEENERLQQSTPSTFQGHSPILRLKLENVHCHLQPSNVLSGWNEIEEEGSTSNSTAPSSKSGTLYITDNSLSFLSSKGNGGFSLDYPSLSLHAISRSIPQPLSGHAGNSDSGCIYCQIDLAGEENEDQENEDEEGLAELWLLPSAPDQVEPLFESISYCASLHPSNAEGDDEGMGNPFSSIGSFGTGLMSTNGNGQGELSSSEAFEDADEGEGEPSSGVNLSETGRTTLARLDALVQWPEDEGDNIKEMERDQLDHATSTIPTEALILTHLPDEVFRHPSLASALLDLLYAYGEMEWWLTLPGFGRAIVMYKETQGAQRAKEALDRLLLPLLDEGEDENESRGEVEVLKGSKEDQEGSALRAYFGDPQALSRLRDEGEQHLPVPSTDRNFLISPPGSPPVGWEPIREDPPNTNTLADDLIRALGSLRDRGLGVRSHTPEPLQDGDDVRKGGSHKRTASSSSLAPPPASIIIPPRQASTLSNHPLVRAESHVEGADEADQYTSSVHENISLPGVTVQNFDIEEDEANAKSGLEAQMNKGLSISSVKATVESMRGAPASLNAMGSGSTKISPTARPPLG